MADNAANRWKNVMTIEPSDGYGVCRCGESMVEEITIVPPPEKRYLTCKAFKDDGLHSRKPWTIGMCDEMARLGRIIVNQAELVQTCTEDEVEEEIAKLKEMVPKVAARMHAIFPFREGCSGGSSKKRRERES